MGTPTRACAGKGGGGRSPSGGIVNPISIYKILSFASPNKYGPYFCKAVYIRGGVSKPHSNFGVYIGTPPELAPERVGGQILRGGSRSLCLPHSNCVIVGGACRTGWLAKLMPPRIYTLILCIFVGLSSAGRSHALFLGLATLGG